MHEHIEVTRFPSFDNVVSQTRIDGQDVSMIITPKVCYFIMGIRFLNVMITFVLMKQEFPDFQ